jgi:hypothetical protein
MPVYRFSTKDVEQIYFNDEVFVPKVDWSLANPIAKYRDMPRHLRQHPTPWDNYFWAHKALLRSSESHIIYVCAKEMARKFKNGAFADLGVFRGGSTVAMAHGINDAKRHSKIYCVDLFGNRELENKFGTRCRNGDVPARLINWCKEENLSAVPIICRGTTEEWGHKVDDVLNMVFIDADHKYENVKKDFELWSPKVRVGGYVGFHDCNVVDVDRVINELPAEYELIHFYYTTKIFRKTA